MKKSSRVLLFLSIVLLLLLTAFASHAQTRKDAGRIFTDYLVEKVDGKIVNEKDVPEKSVYFTAVQLPEAYDTRLILSQTQVMVQTYTDFEFYREWKLNDSERYECVLLIMPNKSYGTVVILQYDPKRNLFFIAYFYGTDKQAKNFIS